MNATGTARPETATDTRDARFDNIKGLLITLVVLGHVLIKIPELSGWRGGGIGTALWCAIYVVHMPVFVFLSGFFTSSKKTMIDHLREALLIYVVAQVAWTAYQCLLSLGGAPLPRINAFLFVLPGEGLWYLLALFLWRCTVPVLARIRYPAVALAALFGYGAAVGLVDNVALEFSISRIICFYPLFALGYWSRQNIWLFADKRFSWKDALIIGVAAICGIIAWKVAYTTSTDLLTLSNPVVNAGIQLRGVAFRLLFYVAALGAVRAFILLAPQSENPITTFGRNSLSIYLGHFYVLQPMLLWLSPEFWLAHMIWIAPVFVFACCALFSLIPIGDYFRKAGDLIARLFLLPAPAQPAAPRAN